MAGTRTCQHTLPHMQVYVSLVEKLQPSCIIFCAMQHSSAAASIDKTSTWVFPSIRCFKCKRVLSHSAQVPSLEGDASARSIGSFTARNSSLGLPRQMVVSTPSVVLMAGHLESVPVLEAIPSEAGRRSSSAKMDVRVE